MHIKDNLLWMLICDTTHSYPCLHLFIFLFISIHLSPTSPVDLLLVFESYSKTFPKYLEKKRYENDF